jgi:hypothetical protein
MISIPILNHLLSDMPPPTFEDAKPQQANIYVDSMLASAFIDVALLSQVQSI